MSNQDFKTLFLDIDKYQSMLDETDDVSEQQAFIETLWEVIVTFVDMGFGVHPVQHALDEMTLQSIRNRGKNDGNTTLSAPDPVEYTICKAKTKKKG